jgi:hypothetical protein
MPKLCDAVILGHCEGMLLGMRAVMRGVARRALTALLAAACLLASVAPLAARQAAEWTRGVTCGMECCKRTGHCCCHKPREAAPAPGVEFAARECPARCGSSAQPTKSGSHLIRPAALSIGAHFVPANPLPDRESGSRESAWLVPSLWQRPPPVSSF